ncbi:MAG TPA: sugar ABC transporter substrate-binding protein [Trueperaceae bacterium]|nr:sugar ABC transporter substrate-binding protein [Trueperaceae bacterium]
MPRMLRRVAVALTAALLLVGTVTAQKITVIMPRHEMDLIGLWEAQTRQFEQASGIQVEFIQMSWDEVANKVLTDLAAGGGTYDVIEFDNGWVAKFESADWVEPLNQYADQAYLDSLVPGLLGTFTKNGQVLGIPWNNDTRFFFYNKAMLDQAGIATPPQTWDEVLADSQTLQSQGIVAFPVTEYWNQEWALANSFAFYLYSFGTDYFSSDGTITIDKPQAVKALTFMVNMLKGEKIANPSSVTLSQEAAADLLYSGDAAFFFQGPPVTQNYANDPARSKVVGQVQAAEWLPAESGASQATLTLPEAFAIPKSSKNKEAAWQYIRYMISPERDRERADKLGSLPLFSALYTDPALLEKYPYWEQFGAQSAKARPLPQVEWYDELVQTSIVAVQRALLGMQTSQQAADSIAAFMNGKTVGDVALHD